MKPHLAFVYNKVVMVLKPKMVAPRLMLILGYLFVVIAISGCMSFSIGSPPDIEKTEYQVEQLPLVAGVYYSPEFRDYSIRVNLIVVSDDKVLYGKRVAESINFALSSLFGKVVELKEWPQTKPFSEALDMVIVPRILRLNNPGGAHLEISLFKASGEEIGEFQVDGYVTGEFWENNNLWCEKGKMHCFSNQYVFPENEQLRNAVANLIVKLATHPAIANMAKEGPQHTSITLKLNQSNNAIDSTVMATGLAIIPKLPPSTSTSKSEKRSIIKSSSTAIFNSKFSWDLEPLRYVEGCLTEAFKGNHPEVKLVPSQSVRSTVFPWLVPGEENNILEVLQRPRLLERLNDIKVRYVAISTLTSEGHVEDHLICGAPGGCFGSRFGELESTLTIQLFDIRTGKITDDPMIAKSKAKSWAIGLIIPIWYNGDEDEMVCADMADQIVKRMAQ